MPSLLSKNNPIFIKILIVASIGIWGTIGYGFINNLLTKEPEPISMEFKTTFAPKQITEDYKFTIQTVERDPFLGTLTKKKAGKKKGATISNVVWKSIKYQGLIENKKAKSKVFLVSINNTQHILKKGQIADSIALVKGNASSVVLRYKGQTKTFNYN
ncbi:hypothetical protein [Pontimicrobium sp. IMCC45349]|uniref:hypothetical protein n=1 Tax=Pontimicrobium sp. IMCC45349 TaxID=3391574 RepID=UPI00399FA581